MQVHVHTSAADIYVLAGYGKTITHVVIGLKTAKGTKQLKLDPSIYESLQKEKVEPGDVIYIEANSGAVKVMMPILLISNSAFCTSQSSRTHGTIYLELIGGKVECSRSLYSKSSVFRCA